MSAAETILVAHLLLDEENPRLPTVQKGQPNTLLAMAKAQGPKLRFLAEDIARYGLDPSYRMIVMPSKTKPDRFVVLDGNRRLTAIRALEKPDAVASVAKRPVIEALRELSPEYLKTPLVEAECVVVSERAEADHWIELRHTGQHRGAGVVGWGSGEASRFRARRSGKPDMATQVLDFLESRGDLTPEARGEVPASTLGRLLGTRDVRPIIGFEVRDGQFTPVEDEDAVADTLLYVTKELASGAVSVGDLYSSKDRVEYAESLPVRMATAAEDAHVADAPSQPESPPEAPPLANTGPDAKAPARYRLPEGRAPPPPSVTS